MTNVEKYNLDPKQVQALVKMGGYMIYEPDGNVIAVMPYEMSRNLVEFRVLAQKKLPLYGWGGIIRQPIGVSVPNRKDPKKMDIGYRGRPKSS